MTLTEFLLARIAEDEARNLHLLGCHHGLSGGVDDCDCGQGARLRVECGAKRRIVEEYASAIREGDGPDVVRGLEHVLRFLALPYADHPDYDEGWRP